MASNKTFLDKFTPLGDRILIKRSETLDRTASGLYIPDTAKEKSQEGDVIAVGEGKYIDGKLIPVAVKPGEHVLFGKYAGNVVPISGNIIPIDIDGREYLLVREEELLGVIRG
jgi:chaperonin GroES